MKYLDQIDENSFELPIYIMNLDIKPERYEYVENQIKCMGLSNYKRWAATDGFTTDPKAMELGGLTEKLANRKGLAGCATSHINLWKHILENNMDWVLILEDDAHFHPDFLKMFSHYWNKIPADAEIIFPGYCGPSFLENTVKNVVSAPVMCLHGYIISAKGAKKLLDKLLPMDLPVDIEIVEYYKRHRGSYIFNGNSYINGIRPNDFKNNNGDKCKFNGIIYQNQEEQGSTIHKMDTVY